jgi:hypothetical protein
MRTTRGEGDTGSESFVAVAVAVNNDVAYTMSLRKE